MAYYNKISCRLHWRLAFILGLHPFAVGPALHMRRPLRVGQVPLRGFVDAGLEGFGGLPAQVTLDFAEVHGVAAVVAVAIHGG